jgi:hypothetical protein
MTGFQGSLVGVFHDRRLEVTFSIFTLYLSVEMFDLVCHFL